MTEDRIALALATPGGHLSIGRGGYSLHYGNPRLSGYDCDTIKTEAIAAGLPVIHSRGVPFEVVLVPAVSGPIVAVNQGRALGLGLCSPLPRGHCLTPHRRRGAHHRGPSGRDGLV